MSTETIRLIRDGEKRGKGVRRWGKREITYLLLHRHHQNDPDLRWAAMKAILIFIDCEGQSHKTVSTNHNLLFSKTGLGFV